MSDAVLYVAAKAPVPGLVKTRLAQTIGCAAAVRLYTAFLEDIAMEVSHADVDAAWFVSPQPPWQPPSLGRRQVTTRLQVGETWGDRQAELFGSRRPGGGAATLLIASDSPQLTATEIGIAASSLEEADVVVGPVEDGGYFLIGQRVGHDLLGGLQMSTGSVCAEVVARARRLRLRVSLLPPQFDVDDEADLDLLARSAERLPHLAATRAALARLGIATARGASS